MPWYARPDYRPGRRAVPSAHRIVAPATPRTAPAAPLPKPFAVISVTQPAQRRADQARKHRLGTRLCQRHRAARQPRLRPPWLSHPGSWRATPTLVAETAGPIQQPPVRSRQRDPHRVADQQHPETAPTPENMHGARRAIRNRRHRGARPRRLERSIPARLGWPGGRRSGKNVPPQWFTGHHDQRRKRPRSAARRQLTAGAAPRCDRAS
jgi:hypothetical protein